jgi:hypothetical protein
MSKKVGEPFEKVEVYEQRIEKYKYEHSTWRFNMRENKIGFFPIFSDDFKNILNDLSGNSLKLYLYLGFHADNKTGETTIRTETIANYFGAKPRTVKTWMKELTDRKLIERVQVSYRRRAITFIRPYPGANYKKPDINDDRI